MRDVGALNLALAVLLIAAAVRATRDLVLVAGLASLAWGVPHLLYHLFNTESLSTGDNIVSLGGLFVFVVLAAMVAMGGRRLPADNATKAG